MAKPPLTFQSIDPTPPGADITGRKPLLKPIRPPLQFTGVE